MYQELEYVITFGLRMTILGGKKSEMYVVH